MKMASFLRAPVSAIAAVLTCGLFLLAVGAASSVHAEGRKTAVFAFEFIDDNASGTDAPAEAERLKKIHAQLRDLLVATGQYVPVDIAPVADAVAKSRNFRDCRSCAEEIAQTLGADVAVTGWVQKVSNLILNVTIVISDAKTGEVIVAGMADMRGNTDESWQRAVAWIAKNRLFQ